MGNNPRVARWVAVGVLGLGGCQKPPPVVTSPGSGAVVLAAGDIADCASLEDEATAAMLDRLPGVIVTLGDNVYPSGTAQAFASCYAPTWGRHRERTRPVPGNHEYLVEGALPYYDYFGAAAGERGKGYYSFELGGWHVVALNSELREEAFAEQVRWLGEDLRAHPARCTLAYLHRPLFTSMAGRDNGFIRPLWEVLYAAGADVVLAGHDHYYERWAPQTPGGELDGERGVRQFVVGTGGRDFYALGAAPPHSEQRVGDQHGVLRLTLGEDGYGWEFLQVAGGVGDSGRATCH